jgi:hypothetical protein
MQPSEENINELQNKIWYIIKPENAQPENNQNPSIQIENESFELNLNDIMKLGRIKYVITELFLNGQYNSIEDKNSNAVFKLILDYNLTIDDPKVNCIYCLQHKADDGGPLINICKCSISLSVHYGCVKTWINTKLTIKKNEYGTVTSYNMKSFNCSVCRTPYPRK